MNLRPVAVAAALATLGAAAAVPSIAAHGSVDEPAATGVEEVHRAQAVRGIRLARVGTFTEPTHIASPPGDRMRRFVTERAGRVVLLRGKRRSTFLDISRRVQNGGESGLLSIAFAPDYSRSRRFYVYYVDRSGAMVVDGFRRSQGSPNRVAQGSRRNVIRQPHSRFNHKGGQIAFGRDGRLYAGFGDGGGSGDPDSNGQDLDKLFGKLLRIVPKPGGGYRVPRDNPFVGRPGRDEIFAYGLRNPYRFSFDRRTGALAVGDVGQNEVEEIDFLPVVKRLRRPRAGVNFGWSAFEGNRRFSAGSAPGHVRPVIERLHSAGSCSITGGVVLRDRALGQLRGSYVYGDLCDSSLRIARLRPGSARADRKLGQEVSTLVSFGEDARGRAYAISLEGAIFRLAPRR